MAIFKVGDKVRIAYPENPNMHGREATIIRIDVGLFWSGREDVVAHRHWLNVDGVGISHPNGRRIAYRPECLRPILPEGWQPVEWSECLWQPEGVAA